MNTKGVRTKFLTHQNAAELNRNAVLNFIKENAPISRTDIWEKMGLSRASVTQIIKQLIDQGFVYETGTGESRGGRKPCYLEFSANARNILVFDWHLKTMFLTNLNSDITFSKPVPVTSSTNADEFITVIAQMVEEIIGAQRLDRDKILGLGLVMPGLIDPAKGEVILSTEQKWENVKLSEALEKLTGIWTVLEADGNMLALGEFLHGMGKATKGFVLMDIVDDGIGSALILDGQLQRGSSYMGGEIGHISLNPEGPQCSCGRKGCLEAFIKTSLKKKTNDWKEEASYYIGLAVSIVINILDPRVVVLSGNVIDRGGDEFVSSIRSAAMENVLKGEERNVCIEKSSLGRYARVKGICGLIYDKSFNMLK